MNKKEIIKLLKDPEVEAAIGTIVLKAFNQAMTRTVKMESGKDNPGGPPVIKEETWNMVDWLMKYFPYAEGALRGTQSDVNKTANNMYRLVQIFRKKETLEALKIAKASYPETKKISG